MILANILCTSAFSKKVVSQISNLPQYYAPHLHGDNDDDIHKKVSFNISQLFTKANRLQI